MSHSDARRLVWSPLPGSQQLFLACPCFEVLLSGTRGGGKTDTLLMDFLQHCGQGYGAEWRGILFRTQFRDLGDVITKSLKWFPEMAPGAKFNVGTSTWKFPDGEQLLFRHIKSPADYQAYHGHAYSWIGWEELTNWPDDQVYRLMMSCSRSTVPGMPRKVRATTNPYGKGHNWIKSRFGLPGDAHRVQAKPGRPERVAIFSYLSENRHLLAAEPDYVAKIKEAARNPSELKAWLKGSWDIVSGGMFDDLWDPDVHCLDPFPIPEGWRLDRSFDWGSSRPFSCCWWAVSDGQDIETPRGRVPTIKGDLFLIHEWYGWNGQPNEGLRMQAADIAAGIVQREMQWGIYGQVKPGVADSAIFSVENGVCIADDMSEKIKINGKHYPGIIWEPSDKSKGSREQGWEQIRKRMANSKKKNNEPRELPGFFVVKQRCPQFLRTVPTLPRDERLLDDVDTQAEDHIGDAVRYRVRWMPPRPGQVTYGHARGAF